jgi:hypothetical protein
VLLKPSPLALLLAVLGCSADPSESTDGSDVDAGGDPCALAAARIAQCAVTLASSDCDPAVPGLACQATCLSEATCEDLQALAQAGPLDPTRQVDLCTMSCADPRSVTTCASGERVLASSVCNATSDCADGSDEVGCGGATGWFSCADGSDTIPPAWQCNGTSECADGSDESGC